MPTFSKASRDKLSTCDIRIQKVMNVVIKDWDCTMLEGTRDKETQNEYFRTGKSKTEWPNSKHNTLPSKAFDVAPYHKTKPHFRWNNARDFYYFAGFVLGIAASMGIKLRHGGDWDKDRDIDDQDFYDLVHFEIVE